MKLTLSLILFLGMTFSSCVTRIDGRCDRPQEYKNMSVVSVMRDAKKAIREYPLKKAVVFGLFGQKKIYTQGIIENLHIARELYPGWDFVVYIHTETVPQAYVDQLKSLGAIIYADASYDHAATRFFIADQNYDVFISRDADSRIYPREVAAVADWLQRDWAILHGMRDYGAQTDPLQAGMWGARVPELREKLKAQYGHANMEKLYNDFKSGQESIYGDDQIFLKDIVIRAVGYEHFLSHESVDCHAFPGSRGFPIPRGNSDTFIGKRIVI